MKAFRGLREKISKGEGGFTLIELLIVIIILGILAAVVAFNVSGFLGAGTAETAKTEKATVQTGVIAGMADISCGALSLSTDSIGPGDPAKSIACVGNNTFNLEDYLKLPTHGTWAWSSSGVVTSGSYAGGGQTCTYTANATTQWNCTAT